MNDLDCQSCLKEQFCFNKQKPSIQLGNRNKTVRKILVAFILAVFIILNTQQITLNFIVVNNFLTQMHMLVPLNTTS